MLNPSLWLRDHTGLWQLFDAIARCQNTINALSGLAEHIQSCKIEKVTYDVALAGFLMSAATSWDADS